MEQFVSFILGFVASHLQGFILKHPEWSEKTRIRVRYGVSFGVCLLVAAGVHIHNLLEGGVFDFEEFLANFGAVFASSQTYYNTYFRFTNQ